MISISRLFEEAESYQIYCDMDGVLTDFRGATRKIGYNGPIPSKGKGKQELWSLIVANAEKFWGDMPWIIGGKRIWNLIKPYQPVLLTSICRDMDSKLGIEGTKGKRRWIERELGKEYLKTALIVAKGTKHKYVSPNAILIDDTKENIDDWIKAGGIGILHKNPQKTINELKKLLNKEINE